MGRVGDEGRDLYDLEVGVEWTVEGWSVKINGKRVKTGPRSKSTSERFPSELVVEVDVSDVFRVDLRPTYVGPDVES